MQGLLEPTLSPEALCKPELDTLSLKVSFQFIRFYSFNVINPNLLLILMLPSNSHIKLKLLL